jgi:hypothetical protein
MTVTEPSERAPESLLRLEAHGFMAPWDRGGIQRGSELRGREYVEDLVRPGRITCVAAEEGVGKSYAIDFDLGIRVAVAGGSFAGTWPIREHTGVLYVSEQHEDDDLEREEVVLRALEVPRSALSGRYWRVGMDEVSGEKLLLDDPKWLDDIVAWCEELHVGVLIFDTATSATSVEPWGAAFREVIHRVRAAVSGYDKYDYPCALAMLLLVHVTKPRASSPSSKLQINRVMGEWGRWSDIVLTMERAGSEHVRLTSAKRIRTPRTILVRQRDGLLVDPTTPGTSKASQSIGRVVELVSAHDGMSLAELALGLGVSKKTAERYAHEAEAAHAITLEKIDSPPRIALYLAENGLTRSTSARQTTSPSDDAVPDALVLGTASARHPPYKGDADGDAVRRDPDEAASGSPW